MKSSEPIISVRHRKVPNCRPYSVVNEMATRSMRIPRVFPTLAYSLYSLHDTKKGIEKKIDTCRSQLAIYYTEIQSNTVIG